MSAGAPAPERPWSDVDHAELARRAGAERARGQDEELRRLAELVGVVYRLRDPDGCPWDREQTLESMAAHLVEEACETADAVAAGDDAHVAEELGDTLMNVVLMARIASQGGGFDLGTVARGIAEKLVRRHPHVFGTRRADDAEQALASWNESKQGEGAASDAGALGGVSASLPALLLALRTGERAAATGFDWNDAMGALDKLEEELGELREACASRAGEAGPGGAVEEELGDLFFAAVNVARKLGLDPELTLRRAVHKFRRRFAAVESELGARLGDASLEEMEALWRLAAQVQRGSR